MHRTLYRRAPFVIAGLVVLLIVGGFWMMSRNSSDHMSDMTQMSSKGSTPDVKIVNFNYTPSEDHVKVGTTVTWTNQDVTPHTVTGDWGTSQLFGKGQSYSHTFETAGTYDYYCQPHPYMKGSIVVEP